MEIICSTTYDRRALSALARALRKTVRRTRSRLLRVWCWVLLVLSLLSAWVSWGEWGTVALNGAVAVLMLAFIAFGISLGFKTVLISHITFNIPYVILSVMPKLKQTDKYTYEAALDLGASPLYAFFKVVFPDIMPGVLSGFLLAFTMSLDDFIITHFTKGAGINTLSTLIYSEVRRGIRPSMYALSSIIFLTVLILLIFVNFRSIKKPEKA